MAGVLTYLGPAGSFAEQALRTVPGADGAELTPVTTVADVLRTVRGGSADAGLVPLESSVEGGVPTTLDDLASGAPLSILREVLLPVTFGLYARVGSSLDEVRRVLRLLDTPIRQVLIEARIVIASDRFSQQLGVRFGQQTGFTFMNGKYAAGSSGSLNTVPVVSLPCTAAGCTRQTRTQTPFDLASGIASAGYSESPQLNVNLPVTNAAGQLALTLINLGSGNLINLELSALEADARGKVVSSPRVVTGDNQKAAIEQGTEIPYVTPGSANSPALPFARLSLPGIFHRPVSRSRSDHFMATVTSRRCAPSSSSLSRSPKVSPAGRAAHSARSSASSNTLSRCRSLPPARFMPLRSGDE